MTSSQKKSWVEFFDRERKRLTNYVRGLIKDAAAYDGEDIVQDVVYGLFDKIDFMAPVENLPAYVYQALRNRVIDYLRRRKEDHQSIHEELPGDTGLLLVDVLEDLKFNTADEIERREINRDLNRAIEMLEEKYRSIFIATELQGLTFQELSDQWEIPLGTLLARKSRAMKKLREALLEIDYVHYSGLFEKGLYYGTSDQKSC